eukprot:10781415-Alexandrium_andersonii.AAC.1
MGDHRKELGRAWLATGARPAGRANPVDVAGRSCRHGAPDGAGCRSGDQGGPHAGGFCHQ